MDKAGFYRENEHFLKILAIHYARNFSLEFDDLFQEGALGMLVAFNRYGSEKKTDELEKIGKKMANRFMYRYVSKEIKRRKFLQ